MRWGVEALFHRGGRFQVFFSQRHLLKAVYYYNNSLRAEIDTIAEGSPALNIDTQVVLTDLGEVLKKKLLADIEAFKGISQQEVQNVIVRLLQDLNKGGK